MSTTSIASNVVNEQADLLATALSVVKVQAFHMKRCLDNNKLMDALKHCSTMLAELRTSSLTPKNYYELYMSIFDELRHLTSFLYDAHMAGRHHLSDLYELVQYAGNIVPRLYLMITVGSVYMRVSKDHYSNKKLGNIPATDTLEKGTQEQAQTLGEKNEAGVSSSATENNNTEDKSDDDNDAPPVKELMRDMLEMARGVQHPTRGLFLRYYLSGMTRDYLPDSLEEGQHGTIHDSIQFILQNFIEMNKLWVRLQHLGHSREREKREQERKELKLLVGSNLVRLSQLDGLDLDMFRTVVLPAILGEIVSCRDTIAQEYLMEVIIQVFQDDYHLHTLDAFLSATAQLSRNVNVKQTVISLIDRFAAFAVRARDEAETKVKEAAASGEPFEVISGIPVEVELFDVFWGQITELVNARPEFTIQDVVALLVSLMNLSLNCYPDRLDHVDTVLGFAKEKMLEAISQKMPELQTAQTRTSLLQLLLSPIQAYKYNPLMLLSFPSSLESRAVIPKLESTNGAGGAFQQLPLSTSIGGNYTDLLFLQPYSTRRKVAHAFARGFIKSSTLVPPPTEHGGKVGMPFRIDSLDSVNAVFGELCSVMVRDQNDGGLFGSKPVSSSDRTPSSTSSIEDEDVQPLDWDDVVEEQNLVAKMVHLIMSPPGGSADEDLQLLSAARKHFGEGGDVRIRFSLPPLVISSIKLTQKFQNLASLDETMKNSRLTLLYKFIHQTLTSLSRAQEYFSEDDYDYARPLFKDDNGGRGSMPASKIGRGLLSPPDVSLRLFLMAAKAADGTAHEELAYEFFVQALTLYEDSVSESRAQAVAMALIVGTLYEVKIFGYENYETLITKCAVHCSRLLKRVDQCRGVVLVSHLFWAGAGGADGAAGAGKPLVAGGGLALDETALKLREDGAIRALKEEGKVVYRDGKRVLECLQKALKIADSVMDQTLNIELFVEILERYIWYFEDRNDAVAIKYLNSLIDLIQTNLANMDTCIRDAPNSVRDAPSLTGPLRGSSTSLFPSAEVTSGNNNGKKVPDHVLRHFSNVLTHLRFRKTEEAKLLVPDMAGGFGGGGVWSELEVDSLLQ